MDTSPAANVTMSLEDSNNNALSINFHRWYMRNNHATISSFHDYKDSVSGTFSFHAPSFVIDFSNAVANSWLLGWGINAGSTSPKKQEYYADLQSTTERVHNIKFSCGTSEFTSSTQIFLYKYQES